MTKNYYEILKINKNATPEEIKAAYRKLALIWHPDKKTPTGYTKEQQAEKFKEIQKAYEILSDATTKTVYDLYGDEFERMNSASDSNEGLNETRRKYYEYEAQKLELQKEEFLIRMRGCSISMIIFEFLDYIEVTENDLDAKLWAPYQDWKEKIRNSSFYEVDTFREQMISAIRKAAKKRKKEDNEGVPVKNDAIRRLEKELSDRKVKIEELEPENRDYRQAINNAGNTVEEILAVEDRIEEDIIKKSKLKAQKNVSTDSANGQKITRHDRREEIPSKRWYRWR